MKKIRNFTRFNWIVALLFCCLGVYGQSNVEHCGFQSTSVGNESIVGQNDCIPFLLNNQCNADGSICIEEQPRIINCNIHVMQKSLEDPQNFVDKPAHRSYIRTYYVDALNNDLLSQLEEELFGGPTGDDYIQNPKIQLRLNEILFHEDAVGWRNNGGVCNSYSYDTYGDPNKCELDIFFLGDTSLHFGGCAQNLFSNWFTVKRAYEKYLEGPSEAYKIRRVIAHELGHCLNLDHSFVNYGGQGQFSDINWPNLDNNDINNPCGSANVPMCSNNIMSYNGGRKHFSPLQIRRMHRQIHFTKSKWLQVDYDPNKSITISGNETWEYGKVVYGDIFVPTGNSLTIKCKLIMPPGGKIRVESGASLIIDGGLLTIASPRCQDYWEGVQVLGTPNTSSIPGNRGVVVMKNQGCIEYANRGVATYDFADADNTQGGLFLTQENGGIFRNCSYSVEIRGDYNSNNFNYIGNTTFEIDEAYNGFADPKFIYAHDMDRYHIDNCTFTDGRGIQPDLFRSVGILALDAAFSVNQCSFTNLYTGIRSGNFATARTYSATENIFDRNYIGIFNRAVDYPLITDNQFLNIGDYFNWTAQNLHAGIFVDNSDGYEIVDNFFYGANLLTAGKTKSGVVIKDSNQKLNQNAYNEIYRNTFDDLEFGNIALGTNRAPFDFQYGLHYLCNNNEGDNIYDFKVYDNGVGPLQREGNVSAGNSFSLNANNTESDFDNQSVASINYYYSNTNVEEEPVSISSLVQKIISNYNQCDRHVEEPGPEPDPNGKLAGLQSDFHSAKNAYEDAQSLYDVQLDNGDTDWLYDYIGDAEDDATESVKATLLDYSPWLSSTILKRVVSSSNLFPPSVMTEILAANPDALNSGALLDFAKEIGDLSSEQIYFLKGQSALATPRTTAMLNLQAQYIAQARATRAIWLHHLHNDNYNDVAINAWLGEQDDLKTSYAKIDFLLQSGDQATAETAINAIVTSDMDFETELEHNYLIDLKQMALDWDDNVNIHELSPMTISNLFAIATNSNDLAGAQANNLLNYIGRDGDWQEPFIPTDVKKSGKRSTVQNGVDVAIKKFLFAYPNPANERVNIEYKLPDFANQEGELIFYNQYGNPVATYSLTNEKGMISIPTTQFESGFYFCTLKVKGANFRTTKVVVTK